MPLRPLTLHRRASIRPCAPPIVPPAERQHTLTDLMLRWTKDPTRWVRNAAYRELGKFIATFVARDLSWTASPSWTPRGGTPLPRSATATLAASAELPVSPLTAALLSISRNGHRRRHGGLSRRASSSLDPKKPLSAAMLRSPSAATVPGRVSPSVLAQVKHLRARSASAAHGGAGMDSSDDDGAVGLAGRCGDEDDDDHGGPASLSSRLLGSVAAALRTLDVEDSSDDDRLGLDAAGGERRPSSVSSLIGDELWRAAQRSAAASGLLRRSSRRRDSSPPLPVLVTAASPSSTEGLGGSMSGDCDHAGVSNDDCGGDTSDGSDGSDGSDSDDATDTSATADGGEFSELGGGGAALLGLRRRDGAQPVPTELVATYVRMPTVDDELKEHCAYHFAGACSSRLRCTPS